MLLWLIFIRPFKTPQNLYINISNELILIIIFCTLYFLETNKGLFPYSNNIGWGLISLVCLAILQCWLIMFPLLIKIIRNKCCPKRKSGDEQNKN